MPQKPKNYPHWEYLELHSIAPSDLPDKLEKAHNLWLNRYERTVHDGRRLDAALKAASVELHKAIKSWYNTDSDFEKLAETPKKNYGKPTDDEILDFFASVKKRETVTRKELLDKGYKKDVFGYIALSTKNYRLKPLKGEKNQYSIHPKKQS